MRWSLTTLELIAGMNQLDGYQKEATIYTLDKPAEFLRVHFETPTDHTFQFDICDQDNSQIGILEFDIEQAYFLHAWLTSVLCLNGYPKDIKENKKK